MSQQTRTATIVRIAPSDPPTNEPSDAGLADLGAALAELSEKVGKRSKHAATTPEEEARSMATAPKPDLAQPTDRPPVGTTATDGDDRAQRICIWAGVAMLAPFFLALWGFADFLPPPAPSDSIAQTAQHYREHRDGLVAAGVLLLLAGTFFLAFGAAISEQIRRIIGQASLIDRLQFAACVVNSVWFSMVGLLWIAAAYRANRDPSTLQFFHDLSWLIMIVPSSHIMMQVLLTGVAVLSDKRRQPLLPRSLGYFCLLDALLYVPAWFAGFTAHGPVAWNGLLSFWLSVVPFGAWTVVMIVSLLRASASSRVTGSNVLPAAAGS